MVHVRFINDQETVVTVPVRPDVDRWVLAVMPVKIKLELLRDTLGVMVAETPTLRLLNMSKTVSST